MGDQSASIESLPPYVRVTRLTNWNRYAAVNDEFVEMHMDDKAGREFGFPGAIGMGNLQIAYIHNFLRDWMGNEGRILRVECEFRAPNLKDTTVTVQGAVTDTEESERGRRSRIVLTVTAHDGQDGPVVILARGSAVVQHRLAD